MTDEEYDEYCENPPDCGNCKHCKTCDFKNDPEFEECYGDGPCDDWEAE